MEEEQKEFINNYQGNDPTMDMLYTDIEIKTRKRYNRLFEDVVYSKKILEISFLNLSQSVLHFYHLIGPIFELDGEYEYQQEKLDIQNLETLQH